jgi:TM2 domain-containing membrane protein YozV
LLAIGVVRRDKQSYPKRAEDERKSMYCRNCGAQLDERAIACPKCGVNPRAGVGYCQNCGKATLPNAAVCTTCGVALVRAGISDPRAGNKIAAGVCGITIGSLGIHKFILGYTGAGLVMLLVTVCTCGLAGIATHLIGLIEGIIYLTKSDEDFVNTYVVNKRPWF